MYVIPIFTNTICDSIKRCWVLLERNGTACISVESMEAAAAFASENGIELLREPRQVGDYVFLDVDSEQTDLAGFYSWSEILPTDHLKEVWRPFLWRDSKIADTDMWGTNTLLNTVQCSPESIGKILTTYFKT